MSAVVRPVFSLAARARSARVFHPRGKVFPAEVVVDDPMPGEHAFARSGRTDGLVRLSRGAGLPPPLPDIHGVALRLVDAYGEGVHQDLLLATTGRRPLTRHLLVPRRRPDSGWYSTLLPYRLDGQGLVMFGARVDTGGREVELAWATLEGPWQRFGHARLGAALPEGEGEPLTFDPWHTAASLRPATWVNRVREAAYVGSREGRGAPEGL